MSSCTEQTPHDALLLRMHAYSNPTCVKAQIPAGGVGGEECTATVIFLLTLACLETFIRSRTRTSFSPPLPEWLMQVKICPWGCSAVISSPSCPCLPGTHHSSNVLPVDDHHHRIGKRADAVGEVGFQHSSTEVEQSCCLLADDVLRNRDHTVISKEGERCQGEEKGTHTSKPQPVIWSAVAAKEAIVYQ